MTITDHIRQQMYDKRGISTRDTRSSLIVSIEIAKMTSKLQEIVDLAKPRLIMGGIRYGSSWNHEDLMDYMQSKFTVYRDTGNFEMLVDLFNFVVVEGQLQTHPNYHFNALDR